MTPTFHTLKVTEVRRETDDTVSVAFEVPEELKETFAYKSGQYLTLRTIIDGEDLRRSYSLCSSAFEQEWRVAIKQVEEGKFSTFANCDIKVGDELQVMNPMGNFCVDLNPQHEKNYVLFAAGSGITPIISIAKSILKEEPDSNVTLFYGNKGFSSIIFREELEALKNKYIDNLSLVHVLSRENLGNTLQKGRIDKEKCESLRKAFLDDVKTDEVYVCGPEEMIFAVREVFEAAGMDKKNIHFELFGTNVKKSDTPVVESGAPSNVFVILDGDTYELAMHAEGQTVLDAAYAAGADLPYACKGGVCCTCKAKILEGTAKMDINYALEPDEIEAGYVLTCQAHPTSEKLVVSFDD